MMDWDSWQEFVRNRTRQDSLPRADAADARRKMIERHRRAGVEPLVPERHEDRDARAHAWREDGSC